MKIMSLEDKIKRLRGLNQYKTKTLQEIKELALKQIEREKRHVDWVGLTSEEEKTADKLYSDYIDNYHIEGFNDLEDLKTLVFNTILEDRIRLSMTPELKDKDEKKVEYKIPTKFTLDSLTSMQKQNLDLKSKLGLNKSKKLGWLDFWASLCEKINVHAVHNRGAFTFKCPDKKCGKMVLLLKKVDDYNTFEWGCFRSTDIYSEQMMKLIDDKKITVEEGAAIFGVSSEYILGMFEKVYLKEKQNVKK